MVRCIKISIENTPLLFTLKTCCFAINLYTSLSCQMTRRHWSVSSTFLSRNSFFPILIRLVKRDGRNCHCL